MLDLNLTLLGQMLTFAVFVWFTMKYVWPPIMKALNERQKKISQGLAAAEQGVRELEAAKHKADESLREAKIQAATIIEEAQKRASQIVDEARDNARQEGERLLQMAQNDIQQEKETARQDLRKELAGLAITGAERILRSNLDQQANDSLLNDLVAEMT